MDKVIYYGRKIILFSLLPITAYFMYVQMFVKPISYDNSERLLNKHSEYYYEMLTDNTGYSNINAISNIKLNLIEDGYIMTKEVIDSESIDIIAEKQGFDTYRIYYQIKDGYTAFFSSSYENSSILYTYINER